MNEFSFGLYDKSDWPDGDWKTEPDLIYWSNEDTNLPCFIRRVENTGHLCGYVATQEDNFFYKQSIENCNGLRVHGGITYAENNFDFFFNFFYGIFDKQEEVRLKSSLLEKLSNFPWVLGFDCRHHKDVTRKDNPKDGTYKDVFYVKDNVNWLARQLKLIGENHQLKRLELEKRYLEEKLKNVNQNVAYIIS